MSHFLRISSSKPSATDIFVIHVMTIIDDMGPEETLIIRDMKAEDYDALVHLWRLAGFPFNADGRDSRRHIEEELRTPMASFLVAESKGRIIDSLLGTTDGRKGWINRLAIHPEWQGKGVALALLREFECRLERKGLRIFSALVNCDNERSRKLLERAGYVADMHVIYYSKRLGKDA
ncbi:MAG: GNAT family N-acetyltransferase [Methanomassiliicoccales archaeon]